MSAKISRFLSKLPHFFTLVTGVFLVWILGLLVLGERWLSFSFHNQALAKNIALYPVSLCVIWLWLFLYRRFPAVAFASKRPVVLLCAAHALLFLVQYTMVRSLWFYPAWDPQPVSIAAQELAQGLPVSTTDYFSMVPHNAALPLLLSLPYRLGLRLGLAEPYVLLPLSGAAAINLACFFSTLALRRISGSWRTAFFGFGLSTVFILLSPYAAVAYSDPFALFFTSLGLYLSVTKLRPTFKWFFVTAVLFLGAAFKATTMIFWIALLLWELLKPKNFQPVASFGKHCLALLLAVALGFLPGLALQQTARHQVTEKDLLAGQLPLSHYLMMGLNPETYGGNSPEDEAFSLSFSSAAERTQANFHKAQERLTAMDWKKTLEFFSVKLYKSYNSGTFAWNGSFLAQEIPRRTDALSTLLRNIYYNGRVYNGYYITFYHILWLAILTLSALVCLLRKKQAAFVPPLSLTLLGLSLYLMLFECWPRYLFLYSTFFVICAALGVQALAAALPPHVKQKKT